MKRTATLNGIRFNQPATFFCHPADDDDQEQQAAAAAATTAV